MDSLIKLVIIFDGRVIKSQLGCVSIQSTGKLDKFAPEISVDTELLDLYMKYEQNHQKK